MPPNVKRSQSSGFKLTILQIDGKSPLPEKDGASVRHELWDREPNTELHAESVK